MILDIMEKIYQNPEMLDYLRRHPKWYYYMDSNPKNYDVFVNVVKKELKETTYDKLEKIKNRVNFASSLINYFNN